MQQEQQKEFLAQLKEVVPDLKRVAILFNRSYAPVPCLLKYGETAARSLGLSPKLVEVAAPSDLPGAFDAMKREGSRAVLVLNHSMFFRERAKFAALAIENGIAVSTPYLRNAEAGAESQRRRFCQRQRAVAPRLKRTRVRDLLTKLATPNKR